MTTKPVGNHKKKDTPTGVFLFGAALLLRKSGRLRAGDLTCKGNPTKVSLAYIPFLAIYRSAHGQQNLWQSQVNKQVWMPCGFHRMALPLTTAATTGCCFSTPTAPWARCAATAPAVSAATDSRTVWRAMLWMRI